MELIARTHAELGHGHMATRREKVSRWESGRIVPELTAQLAIARIHRIDESLVLRLGWPQWMLAATGDDQLLSRPWTPHGAIMATRFTAAEAGNPGPALIATGPALATQIRGALAALDGNNNPPERDGPRISLEVLTWAERRIRTIENLETGTPVPLDALHLAARTEHRLIADLLTSHGYDRATGTRLLLLAARTAALCTWTSYVTGAEVQTERYNLAAIRAASASGASYRTAASVLQLCYRHLRRGHPGDALSLLQAARVMIPRSSPRLTVIMHSHQTLVHARLAEPAAAFRSLRKAEQAVTQSSSPSDTDADPTGATIDEEYIAAVHGEMWLRLGQPARALSCFGSLLADEASPRGLPSPFDPVRLRPVVAAQLAAGQIDGAASTIHRAIIRTGGLPPMIAAGFRRQLAPYSSHPHARDAIEHLIGQTAPRSSAV
ncbi:hypothetical protein ACFC6U_24130 [Kitasatospora purpeofusca]|uniref:hypothetical protein n=1 Tax=Kitasatospora purpeofusca TaxID=67352 RepID=UPI0035DEDD12